MAGLGQDQGQAQIVTGSDALSVESTIILGGNVWPNKKRENRTNTTNVQFRWWTDTDLDLINGHGQWRNDNTNR